MSDYYGAPRRVLVREAWFWIAMVFVAVLVIGAVSFGLRWALAGPRGQLQAREQILSGSFRIAAYNHFFDACAAIQGLEGQLDAQYAEAKTATGGDLDRVQANIAGIKGARAQSIAEYNADAQKNYTIGQFKSAKLPYQLPTTTYHEGMKTTCATP